MFSGISVSLMLGALFLTIFALVMYFREFYIKGYFKKENLKLNEETNNKSN